jgi:hypothetical protein
MATAIVLGTLLTLPASRPANALSDNQFDCRQETTVASSSVFTKPKELVYLVSTEGGSYRIRLTIASNQPPTWINPTFTALIGIHRLPDNWDSYGSKKVNREIISRSLFVLERIMDEASPAPSIVPLGDGGIQFEWHRKQQDLEITFTADDTPQYFYQNRATGMEQLGSARDVMNLTQLLRNIA